MADLVARGPRAGNGITIRDAEMADAPGAANGPGGGAEEKVDARVEADSDYARQLQAKLDAEEARSGSGRHACSVVPCFFLLLRNAGDAWSASGSLDQRFVSLAQLSHGALP